MPSHYFEQCKMDENNFKVFIGNQLLAITFCIDFFKNFLFVKMHIYENKEKV